VVTSISAIPANPFAGQAITFSAVVKNQGSATTPAGIVIGVQFQVDGQVVNWSDNYNAPLAPGASVTIFANTGPLGLSTYTTSVVGPHTVLAWVNDSGRFMESNIVNNQLTTTVTVSPAAGPTTLKTSGGYCLERSQQTDSYGANKLVQAPCSGSTKQSFNKTVVSTDVFLVASAFSGQCINVPAGLTDEGLIIDFWECYPDYLGHQWRFSDNGGGTFKMIDSLSQKCLTYNNYSTGTNQQLYISTCQAGNSNQVFHY
jgi:hypothetical protein